MTDKEFLEQIYSKVPKAPNGVAEWIYNKCVTQQFILYDSKNNVAACTRCGTVFGIEPGEYTGLAGHSDICPHCQNEGQLMPAGRGRKNKTEWFRILVFANKGKTIYATLWEIQAEFDKFGRPSIGRYLSAVYKLNHKTQEYWKAHWYWGSMKTWTQIKNVRLASPPCGTWGQCKFDHTSIFTENLESVFKKTDAKYLWDVWQDFNKNDNRWSYIIQFLVKGMKYQSIELAYKAGFTKLVSSYVTEYGAGKCNWRATNLQKILRMPKGEVRKLREINPTAEEVIVYRECKKRGINYPGTVLKAEFDRVGCRLPEVLDEIETYVPVGKWIKYATKQHEKQLEEGTLPRWTYYTGDWLDYIRTASKLGMDLHRKDVLYPTDLKEAHDRAMKEYRVNKDKLRLEAIAKRARIEEYESGNFMIVSATTQDMLNEESKALNHCVRTYGDKIAEGRCWIFFIRQLADPGKPFYTLETDTKGNCIQCRGDHNCDMTDEVRAFKDGFIKHLQKKLKSEQRSEQLCKTA